MLVSRLRRTFRHRALLHLLLVAALTTTAVGARAASISFLPSDAEVNCNEQVMIDIVIDGTSDLRGFSLEIEFDPTLLELVSVVAGPDLSGAPCPSFFHLFPYTSGDSAFQVDGSGLGCSLAGPARVATMVFEGASDGLSILDCGLSDLRNSLNLPIPATCEVGTVLVNCPVGTLQTGWGPLKARWR